MRTSVLILVASLAVALCHVSQDQPLDDDNGDVEYYYDHEGNSSNVNDNAGDLTHYFYNDEANSSNIVNVSAVHGRSKRAVPLIPLLLGAVLGAGTSAAASEITKFHSGVGSHQCRVSIVHCRGDQRSSVNMNFKSALRNNWNNEKLDNGRGACSYDKTRENVSGGRLRLIQFWFKGHSCISDIVFSCGSEVLGNQKSVHISGPGMLAAAAARDRKWLHRASKGGKECAWFSHKSLNIRAVDFYPAIFTCGENDSRCKQGHMQVFFNK